VFCVVIVFIGIHILSYLLYLFVYLYFSAYFVFLFIYLFLFPLLATFEFSLEAGEMVVLVPSTFNAGKNLKKKKKTTKKKTELTKDK
jgi:hypothetical protein